MADVKSSSSCFPAIFSASAVETSAIFRLKPWRKARASPVTRASGSKRWPKGILHLHGNSYAAFEAISRSQAQLLIVGRLTATEKVGGFLLAMSGRLSVGPADVVALPISRYDFADYLAISVETVSRSLTELRRRGLIAFMGTRRVRIIDRNSLEDLHGMPTPRRAPSKPRFAVG